MRHAAAIVRRSRKEARLEARVTPEQKRLIARPAALRGFSVTEFVVAGAQQAASNAIKEFELLTLHDHGREVFVNAVLHHRPTKPLVRLQDATKDRWDANWLARRRNPRLGLSRSD
jgi:uncharacterized protein (DUF1778 family)